MPNIRRPRGTSDFVRQITTSNGDTAYMEVIAAGDAAGNIVGENPFNFASVTGGLTTTADTPVAAAAGAGISNFLTGLYFKNTSAVASEIVVKDGATVVFRGHAGASMAQGERILFNQPIKGTANTAMNVAMITTGTATIVSAQGFTGA